MRRRVSVGKAFDLSVSLDGETPNPGPGKSKSKKPSPRRVVVGREFEAKVSLSGDWADATDAVTRSRIVWAVFTVSAIFLFGAALLGLYKGDFNALQAAWGVVG